MPNSGRWLFILFSVLLCACTILSPHVEHSKADAYAFERLNKVLVYSDYGLLAPGYDRDIREHILPALGTSGLSAKYLAERIEFSISRAVKKARKHGMDHVIVMHNARHLRKGSAWRGKMQVKVVEVESGDTVYAGMFWMTGQTLNQNTYARELSKSIVAHLQNPG